MDWYNQIPNFDSGNDASAHPFNGSTNGDWVSAGQHDILQGMQPSTAFPSAPSFALSGQMIGSGESDTFPILPNDDQILHANSAPYFLSCIGCLREFENTNQLNKHAKEVTHHVYGCKCGSHFTRLDALNRHITAKTSMAPQFPCEYCYEHQGMKGFHRRDHLVQHLKVFHRINTLDKLAKDSAVSVLSTATTPAANSVPGGQNVFQQGPPLMPSTIPEHFTVGVNGYFPQGDFNSHNPQVDFNGYSTQVDLHDPLMVMGFQGLQGQDAPQPQVPVPAQQQQMDFGFDLDFQL